MVSGFLRLQTLLNAINLGSIKKIEAKYRDLLRNWSRSLYVRNESYFRVIIDDEISVRLKLWQ